MGIHRHSVHFVCFLLCTFLLIGKAQALPVNLSSFDVVDPTVTVFGPDQSSATILEDPTIFGPVGLWETGLPIPSDATSLTFSYELQVRTGNEDYFDFYFGDLLGPIEWYGGFEDIYSGSITKRLTGFAGGVLPIAFALNYGWNDFGLDSVLTIENVTINQGQVSEPSALLLMSMGLLLLPGLSRRQTA
jgi:hypothetical protein